MRHLGELATCLASADRLTVGQMAELCCVSRRALRLYHEKGLLSPAKLDEDTGYRYYSLDQMPVVDRISRLQDVGFSLSDIKVLLKGCDSLESARLYQKQLERTERELARLSAARDMLEEFLVTQCADADALPMNRIVLEWCPERKAMYYDLGDLSLSLSRSYDHEKALTWYCILSMMRRELRSRGVPEVVFNEVCTVITKESLEGRDLVVSRACIFVHDALARYVRDYEVVPAGYCLTYRADNFFDERGEYLERKAVLAMLDYAERMGYTVRGDYIGLGNIDVPLDANLCRKDFLRFQLPVRVGE